VDKAGEPQASPRPQRDSAGVGAAALLLVATDWLPVVLLLGPALPLLAVAGAGLATLPLLEDRALRTGVVGSAAIGALAGGVAAGVGSSALLLPVAFAADSGPNDGGWGRRAASWTGGLGGAGIIAATGLGASAGAGVGGGPCGFAFAEPLE
jgi:hypothetical protein